MNNIEKNIKTNDKSLEQEQIFSLFKPEEINQLLKAIQGYYINNSLHNDYDEYNDYPYTLSPFNLKTNENGLAFDLSFYPNEILRAKIHLTISFHNQFTSLKYNKEDSNNHHVVNIVNMINETIKQIYQQNF